MARALTTATRDGDRAEQLQILAAKLAKAIQKCDDVKTLAGLAKQYRETIRELDELKGAENDDDAIAKVLGFRSDHGKPGAVRKNRA